MITTTVITTVVGGQSVSPSDPLYVAQNGVINATTALNYTNSQARQSATIAGTVIVSSIGAIVGDDDVLTVTQSGTVLANASVFADGVWMSGDNATVSIAGTLAAEDHVIFVTDDGNKIDITETGFVRAGTNGFFDDSLPASSLLHIEGNNTTVRNFGTVTTDLNPQTGQRSAFENGTSISTGIGVDLKVNLSAVLINGGSMVGNVYFGAGVDVYRGVKDGFVDGTICMDDGNDFMVGGSEKDDVVGGLGNDIIAGRAGADDLAGGAGADLIRGGKDDDQILGNDGGDDIFGGRGDDSIFGGNGKDDITGGKGDDDMRGGGGTDTFVFRGRFGDDTIGDFAKTNAEKIDLSKVAAIRSFNDLNNNHLSQQGSDAVIEDGNGNSIALLNFNSTDLDAGDFIF